MTADAPAFLTLSAYLDSLPDGIESYPHCVAKASLLRAVIEELGGPRVIETIPRALAQQLAAPAPPNAWIPEVIYVAAHYALAEATGVDQETMLQATYRANRKLTESRMYRALAKVASPELMLRGSELGWKLIHRGVTLRTHSIPGKSEIVVRHPPGLWPASAHESAALGFRAVVEAAHGRNPAARVVESRPDGASFEVTWT